jgi:hypothetical protein
VIRLLFTLACLIRLNTITHISNRYNIDEVTSIYNELSLDQTSPHFYFVKDFDTFKSQYDIVSMFEDCLGAAVNRSMELSHKEDE